jgi:hypothetical protein
MAAQIKEAKTPLSKMSWHPDVPSSAMGPEEYNATQSRNVETDVRGVRSVLGDEPILDALTGTPIYVTGGYRLDDSWWYIVGTAEGVWYGSDDGASWTDITPIYTPLVGYSEDMNITEAWNGTTLIINDGVNPPMILLGGAARFEAYSNTPPQQILSITGDGTTVVYEFATWTGLGLPFPVGEFVRIRNCVPDTYNGVYEIIDATDNTITVYNAETASPDELGTIRPYWIWNYNNAFTSLSAGFVRLFNSPNVGSILIAGNLTGNLGDSTEQYFPNTVRWSQAFGIDQAPSTWEPSLDNVANELEVPLRGPVLDGFAAGGNFFVQSYWDTVVFSPINYQTTTIPILGVRQFTQGRGLLTTNAWSSADDLVIGIDARDIWVFNGQQFKGLGNQRIKNYILGNINPDYVERIFVENNTNKNQIEIYYPDLNSTGWCNKMISYRYDLDVFNPPRDIPDGSFATEGPLWTTLPDSSLGYDDSYRTVVYVRGVASSELVQKDISFEFITGPITSVFRRDNILVLPNYSQQVMIHRVLPAVNNLDDDNLVTTSTGTIDVTVGGSNSVGEPITLKNTVTLDIDTDNPWCQITQNVFRTNTIILENTSSTTCWICTGITWQFTETQDAV